MQFCEIKEYLGKFYQLLRGFVFKADVPRLTQEAIERIIERINGSSEN